MNEVELNILGAKVDRARKIKEMVKCLKEFSQITKNLERGRLLSVDRFGVEFDAGIIDQLETAYKTNIVYETEKIISSLEREFECL